VYAAIWFVRQTLKQVISIVIDRIALGQDLERSFFSGKYFRNDPADKNKK
jgi:hypothetical protein